MRLRIPVIALCAIVLLAPRAKSLGGEGEQVGRLQIPRIGLDVVILEGVADATLRKGAGHVPETAWPAPGRHERGNCVITGHRDSFFLPLRRARAGDLVRVVNASGSSRTFRLRSKRVVSPEAYSVMDQTRTPRLTLITCYPFRWKGHAPSRLVWTATPTAAEKTPGR